MTRPIVPTTMPAGRRRGGFTLVELLIVVGIILLLIAAGAVSYSSIAASGRDRETRSTLMRLVTVATEYEALSGRIVNHHTPFNNGNDNPYRLPNLANFDWNETREGNHREDPTQPFVTGTLSANNEAEFVARSIERFVWATHQVPAIRDEIYGAFDDEVFGDEDGNGFLELRDGWGNRIVYVAYVAHDGNANSNPPGDGFNIDDFLPRRDRPYFASAGRSGDFGNVNGDQAQRQAAEDNIYSFDLD